VHFRLLIGHPDPVLPAILAREVELEDGVYSLSFGGVESLVNVLKYFFDRR
jgi:hypothetical protein